MKLKWPGIWYQPSRAAPGVLASRHCLSKVAVTGPVAYTLHKGMRGAENLTRHGS